MDCEKLLLAAQHMHTHLHKVKQHIYLLTLTKVKRSTEYKAVML